eukprot:TRINITY_DN36029_c0_g1_i1.p1 TRINITY_DN36029_c0_g1~~TRINITY_DN36029_c0_g1_i1.p1  ORF type:complete len:244 (+),score=71.70 TRINITY_DN36029_c0_g1_i1:54-785(+)
MKFNIADQQNGTQKTLSIDNDKLLATHVYDKRIANEISGAVLGDEFDDYVFKITGGYDKQGFAMKQGIATARRVKLLLGANTGFFKPKRNGQRRKKAVRGCIVSPEISVLHLTILKRGKVHIDGITNKEVPKRLGPKRASKIRALFNLPRGADVRPHVVRRTIAPKKEGDKERTKAPKIQRLVTPRRIQRKKHELRVKIARIEKNKREAAAYQKLLAQRRAKAREEAQSKKSKKSKLSKKAAK